MDAVRGIFKHGDAVARFGGEHKWLWCLGDPLHHIGVKLGKGAEECGVFAIILFAQEQRMFAKLQPTLLPLPFFNFPLHPTREGRRTIREVFPG